MVFYSFEAYDDMDNIFYGLLNWQTKNNQPYMSYEEVVKYRNALFDFGDSLDTKFHFRAEYPDHLKYGSYVAPYKKNNRTTWYFIYDIENGNIHINRIMSNYNRLYIH